MRKTMAGAVVAVLAMSGVSHSAELRAGVYKYDGGSAVYVIQDSQHYICDNCPGLPALKAAVPIFDGGFIAGPQPLGALPAEPAKSEAPQAAIAAGPFAEVFFSLNQARINQEEATRLKERMASLEPGVPVVVEGYACKLGPRSYNMKLSMRRAKAVAAYVESLGVKVANVSWYGESRQQDVSLVKNRKAVIQIRERNFTDERIR